MNADPYQTGVQNIQVFAYLGPYQDPSTASPAQLPKVQMGGGNLFYSFTEPFGVSGIIYGAQWSATMQPNDWHPVPDTGDGIGQVICSHLKQWHQNAEFCSRESSKRKFPATRTICRHERLGGLLNYYYGEAA